MRPARYTTTAPELTPAVRRGLESTRDACLVMAAEAHLLLEGIPATFSIVDASFVVHAEQVFWSVVDG